MATPTEEKEQPSLSQYLNDILPKLSLDPETYIPYITGCLENFQDNDEEEDELELDEIIELLQASSESHSDDEQAWTDLKQDILVYHRQKVIIEKERKMTDQREREESDRRKKEMEMEEALREVEKKKQQEEERAQKRMEIDPAKRAIIEQYAYDTSERYDNDGNLVEASDGGGGGTAAGEGDEDISNRAHAEKLSREKAQQMRGGNNSSKKEERQKTKSAKIDKIKQKEDRRKRAVKGERKR